MNDIYDPTREPKKHKKKKKKKSEDHPMHEEYAEMEPVKS